MLFRSELEARTAETYAIKKLRAGGMNLYNRNVGGGGKDGSVNDFRTLKKDYINDIENIIKSRSFPYFKNGTEVKDLVNSVLTRIVTGEIERVEERLDVLYKYEYYQVRKTRIIRNHVIELMDLMEENPALFRAKTDPIVVIVDDRNITKIKNFLIGGNHRKTAAEEIGWETFPTVYVNFSELEYIDYALTLIGENDNIMGRKIEKSMDSEDIKFMLENFHAAYPEYHPTSIVFRDLFASMHCGGNLSETRLRKAATNWGKAYNEGQIAQKYNFHQYSSPELDILKSDLTTQFYDAVVVRDNAASIMNNGIGGILNSFGEELDHSKSFFRNPKKHGIIMARFPNTNDITNEEQYVQKLNNAMNVAGFTMVANCVWTNASGYKISLDRKSTRLNSSHTDISRMPSSA